MGKKKASRRSVLDNKLIQWHDESIPAAKFLNEHSLPRIAKLNSGNYGNFGCGTEVNVSQPFLLHTARHCTKVLAESLEWDKIYSKYVDTGNQIVIPTNYPGWFSYSREEKHKFVPWTSIEEISFHNTTRILSCLPITCYQQSGCNANGQRIYVKKVCPAGEIFHLGDRYVERTTRRKAACCFSWVRNKKLTKESVDEVEYVLAKDSSNVDLLIPIDAKGMFCKIGRVLSDGRIESQAVYKINDLLDVIDLPCFIELVYGKSPSKVREFTGMLRLEEAYKEETVIACSLGMESFTLMEFPIDSEIEFIPAMNHEKLLDTSPVEQAIEFCLEEVLPYIVSLKVIQNFFSGTQGIEEIEQQSKPQKVPVPPPLPLLGPEEEEDTHGCGKTNHDGYVDDFSDDGTYRSQDTHYETIPFDKVRESGNMHSRNIIREQTEDTNAESEYLVPVRSSSAVYSNINNREKRPKRQPSNTSSDKKFGAVCPANSVMNGADDFVLNEFLINRDTSVLNKLPPVGKERMDKFLQDSLEELNRVRLSGEFNSTPPNIAPKPQLKTQKQPPEMKAKLDAFLDDIFDCDTLEKGQLAPRMINSPPENKQSTPNLSIKNGNMNPPLVRSQSDVQIQPGSSMSTGSHQVLYNQINERISECGNAEMINDRDAQNDSSSSSRSVSDIYRQMKYPHFHHSGSITADYPYPRTDSGIVVSPRYMTSERGSLRNVYHAMSEMSWRPPQNIASLSVEEIAVSLLYIGLKQESANAFSDQQIDGKQLLEMDESLLVEGFPELNALERKKVLDFIKGWRPKKLFV